jgi:hypothetical protein
MTQACLRGNVRELSTPVVTMRPNLQGNSSRDVTVMGVTALGGGHFIHDELPRPFGRFGVNGAEIRQGDGMVEVRLPVRFILGMEQGGGGGFVLGAEGMLFTGLGVLAIVGAIATIQDELRFHFCLSVGNNISSGDPSLLSSV